MAVKGETRLQRSIQRALKREFKLFVVKIHGNEFQRAGIPDLLLCCAGLFFAFEVKMPRGRVSAVQKEVMAEIREAGGYAKVVEDAQTAISYLRGILAKEKRLRQSIASAPVARRTLRERKKIVRSLLQAAPRKNLHRRGRH